MCYTTTTHFWKLKKMYAFLYLIYYISKLKERKYDYVTKNVINN